MSAGRLTALADACCTAAAEASTISLAGSAPGTASAHPPNTTEAEAVAPFPDIDSALTTALTFCVGVRAHSDVAAEMYGPAIHSALPRAGDKRPRDEEEEQGDLAPPCQIARHEEEHAAQIERKDREIAALHSQLAAERTANAETAAEAVATTLLAQRAVAHAREIMGRSLEMSLTPLPASSYLEVRATLRTERAARVRFEAGALFGEKLEQLELWEI